MTPFVERIIYNQIKLGLQPFIDDPKLYEQFLLLGGLDADEALRAREYFVEHPPHLIMGYARDGGPFPAWALVLGSESVTQDYIGEDGTGRDDEGLLFMDDDGNVVDAHVRRMTKRYEIYIYTDHPDITIYYYQLLKHICMASRTAFQQADLDEMVYDGADLAPDERYLPSNVYVRRLGMTVRADEEYFEPLKSGVGAGARVSGIAVDDGHSLIPEEIVAVGPDGQPISAIKTNIITYVPGV